MSDTKHCSRCNTTKDVKEFSKATRRKDGLQTFCKECAAAHNKIYYQKHAKRMRRQSGSAYKKRIERGKKWLRQYLESHSCVDCGTTDIRVFEFDHVRGVKEKNVSRLIADGHSIKRIKKEISKCEIVCANCHRIRTFERNGGNYRTIEYSPAP